jgi:hypothetical protein
MGAAIKVAVYVYSDGIKKNELLIKLLNFTGKVFEDDSMLVLESRRNFIHLQKHTINIIITNNVII